jgi:UDP-GlcNAc:undecaprenyl-phosphate/decaprenyl-phosphate GlcNAc-1-phosphate transferase
METWILLAAAGLCALVVNFAALPVIIKVSHKRGWFDVPNGRKVHTDLTPRLGGIGIFVSFLVAVVAVPPIVGLIRGTAVVELFQLRYLPLAVAFCIMSAIGLVDDFYTLRAMVKFILQIIAAILVCVGGITIGPFALPGGRVFSLGLAAYPLTILWIVGLSNALNLVDGVDGFAGGIAVFAALSLGVMAVIQGSPVQALVAVSLVGSISAFLVFNFPPARLFMGDSGAYLLGFTLSILPLIPGPGAESSPGILAAAATLLTIPIIDTISAIVRRLSQRRSIGTPDKEHVHHKLREIGLRDRKLVVVTYLYSVLLSAASIGAFILKGLAATLIFAAVWAFSIVAYFALKKAEVRGRASTANPAGTA